MHVVFMQSNSNKPKAFHTSFSSSWNRDKTRNCEMKKKQKDSLWLIIFEGQREWVKLGCQRGLPSQHWWKQHKKTTSQEVHKKMMKGYLLIGFVKVKPLHPTSKWSGHWWKRFDGKFALRKTRRWLLCCGIRDSI
jgi:hypothetical protein